MIVDFEGEPLRPSDDRSHFDTPLRDVAGVLRSLSYFAAMYAHHHATHTTIARDWKAAAIREFLDGYGTEPSPLLHALQVDKALYEITYEAAFRPGWVRFPYTDLTRELLC